MSTKVSTTATTQTTRVVVKNAKVEYVRPVPRRPSSVYKVSAHEPLKKDR